MRSGSRRKANTIVGAVLLALAAPSAMACLGSQLTAQDPARDPSQAFNNRFFDTGNNTYRKNQILTEPQSNSTGVVGGERTQLIVDPTTLPPAPGSDTGGGPGHKAPGQTGVTVRKARDDANKAYNLYRPKKGGWAFIIGHLANGDYYGNTLNNHTNFVVLTKFANDTHKFIELKTKALINRFHSYYHDFNKTHFVAYESATVAYKPVVYIDIEASSTSIFDAGNSLFFYTDENGNLPAGADTAVKRMPDWIEQRVSIYMRKYTYDGTKWNATEEFSVMPQSVFDDPQLGLSTDVTQGGQTYKVLMGDVAMNGPIQYTYSQETGPTFSLRVRNEGPYAEDVP